MPNPFSRIVDRVITRLAVKRYVEDYYWYLHAKDCCSWTREEVWGKLTSFVLQEQRLPHWRELRCM